VKYLAPYASASVAALLLSTKLASAQAPVPTANPPVTPSPLPAATPREGAAMARPHTPVLQSAPTVAAAPITLADAVAKAIARNPTYETAQQEIRRTQAIVREVESTWLPTLYGNGVYEHLDHSRIEGSGALTTVVLPQNSLNLNLLLTVPIIMPRQWANTSISKDNVKAQRASTEDVLRQVALSTGRAYLAVYAQKLVIEVDERARDTAKKHYDYAHKRYTGGVGTSLDEVRAAQEVAGDEALVQQAYSSLSNAQEALGITVGVEGPLDSTEDPGLAAPPTLAAGLQDAEHRTDVIAYDIRRRAAERVTHFDYTDYLPYLVGNAEPFYQDPSTPTIPKTGYQMELILTIPLYDGGLRYGQARERNALSVEARIAFDNQLRQARSVGRAAFEALRRADDALTASRDASRLANQALDLANLAYTAGATSDIEVIDAERAARDAETQAEIAADTSRQARLNLLSATNHFP
jgi:outer membrane protein TolC